MKIIVTGGSGLTGKSLKEILPEAVYLSSKDYDLINYDEVEKMYQDHKPTHVVHLAARVGGIVENISYPCDFFEENIFMNSNVVRLARKYNVKRLLTTLTSCSYPNVSDEYPMVEKNFFDGPPAETNFSYAMSKRSLATQINASNKQYGTEYNYIIPCNLYGEHDNFNHGTKMHFITALIKKIDDARKNNDNNIILFGSGKPLRQFMHAHDLANIIKLTIENDITECFNVAPPNQNLSIHEMAVQALDAMDVNLKIKYDKDKPDGQYNKEICTKKLSDIFPNYEFLSLKDGISRIINSGVL